MYDSMDPGGLALHTSIKTSILCSKVASKIKVCPHICANVFIHNALQSTSVYYCTGQGDSTSIWVYVVVAVLAVTIVLVLAVVVVGVWLKRSLSTKSADLTTNCTPKAHHTCTCLRYQRYCMRCVKEGPFLPVVFLFHSSFHSRKQPWRVIL